MSDRIAVMSGGWSSRSARPEEIYHRPATAFVAGFIGEANLLRGHGRGGGPGRSHGGAPGAASRSDGVPRAASPASRAPSRRDRVPGPIIAPRPSSVAGGQVIAHAGPVRRRPAPGDRATTCRAERRPTPSPLGRPRVRPIARRPSTPTSTPTQHLPPDPPDRRLVARPGSPSVPTGPARRLRRVGAAAGLLGPSLLAPAARTTTWSGGPAEAVTATPALRQLAGLHRRGDRRALRRGHRHRLHLHEDINDNNEYFAQIQADLCSAGSRSVPTSSPPPTGWPPASSSSAWSRSSRSTRSPTRRTWCRPAEPGVGPRRAQVQPAVAVGHDRHRLQHRRDRASSQQSRTCSTRPTAARSACSPRCATPSGS